MHLYTAAVYTNQYMPGMRLHEDLTEHEKEITRNLPNILESWHYVGKQRFVDAMRANVNAMQGKWDNAGKVFLDSGAFSAYTLGVQLSVENYCNYIKTNQDIIRIEDGVVMASVLDGIGDPLATYRNQLEMEARGVRPMPCFHSGEDERYLDHYVANYDYITLGGMVGGSVKQLMTWLDRIWENHLTDGSGRAKCKVHGFGITSRPLMDRYPWYSTDSSSWIQATAFGVIETPQIGPLPVSDKSPARHDWGQHYSTLTPIEQDKVCQWLEEAGFTYERLSTVYQSRAAYNLWAYGVIGAMINYNKSEVFRAQVQELF